MPEQPASAIANFADLGNGQIALSRFIVQHDGGLYVKLSRLDSAADFFDFVDRVMAAGLYFRGLDYTQFLSLLYDDPAISGARGNDAGDEVFVASDITTFRPERQALYKSLRIERGEAVYLFEPVYLEVAVGQAPGEAGEAHARRRRKPAEERTYLDIHEFIASAWQKGVRFGIDLDVVRAGIELDTPERRVVARSRPCVAGKDAEIQESAAGLRRNDAPRRLLNGRVDLNQFETRYPQVTAGLRLVKKIPRTAGIDGRDISGKLLEAPLPSDLELADLAGPGTRVSQEKDAEYLVAAVGGFLSIDRNSNQFSITDKIVSHEGVSARTTGNISLTGEIYEQHGEIEEKRIVKCRSITAYADVFGNILSMGGVVHLKHNLVGGSASNDDGDIVVDGVASGATLIAPRGCVSVKRAENCFILAQRVIIENTTRCDIVADEVHIQVCDACAVAGKTLHVRISRAHRELDTVLLLLLPDLSNYETKIAAVQQKRAALAKVIAAQRQKIDSLRNEKDVSSYLSLAGKLRRHEVTLSAEQQAGWRRLSALVAPALRTLASLSETANEMEIEAAAFGAQIDEISAARESSCRGLACSIAAVEGETRVSMFLVRLTETPLTALPAKELKARLRRTDGAMKRLFAGSSGSFSWAYRTPPG